MKTKIKFLGKEFSSPLLPASGPLSANLEDLLWFENNLTGGIVTKTISVKGAIVKKPCIYADKNMVYNSELWSEYDYLYWINEILPKLKKNSKKPIFISVGYHENDFKTILPKLSPFADYFEVSTHYAKSDLEDLVKALVDNTDKPVFMKLSPHIPDYLHFVETIVKAGATGVVAINSVGPGLKINLAKREVFLGTENGSCWISGPAIKPYALQRVADIRKHFPDTPIISAGGIKDAKDVLEFLLAGADLVQMLSEALINGREVYNTIVKNIPATLDKYNFKSLEEVRQTGLALSKSSLPDYPKFQENCTLCGLCVKICPEQALQQKEKIIIDKSKCVTCGLCESRCPVKAISGIY